MKKLLVVCLLSLLSSAAFATVQTIKVEVHGMVCAFCAQGIEKKMRALPQTRDVVVDLKNKVVAVELKDGQQLAHDTVKALIKDAGYDVPRIETVNSSARDIRNTLRGKK
jgi:cation transport ATPase